MRKRRTLQGKAVYDVERGSTDWKFGEPNPSFSMDEKGNLVQVAVVETSKMREAISGSGYFQEILPLRGKTVLVGEGWNVSLYFNPSVVLVNQTALTMLNGTIQCRVVRKKTVNTSAGSFSVVEVGSYASTSQTPW